MEDTVEFVEQRVRNRIIEYLQLVVSAEGQRAYQEAVPLVNVTDELINQWEDWAPEHLAAQRVPLAYSDAEVLALRAFAEVWEFVASATPNPMPPLEEFIDTAEWLALREAAQAALDVLEIRGKGPED